MSHLRTIADSGDRKTGHIAVTYRAGTTNANKFGTCPISCPLKPADQGTDMLDRRYTEAMIKAVPRRGKAWTYSHFPPKQWIQLWRSLAGKPRTTINASATTTRQAARWAKAKIPAVVALPVDQAPAKHMQAHGVRFVRCLAEYIDDITCSNCGNGSPLCERADRDFVIVFTAHGTSKQHVGDPDSGKGCYAVHHHVGKHWDRFATLPATNDAETVAGFAEDLPRFSLLRHHVAGDLGLDT